MSEDWKEVAVGTHLPVWFVRSSHIANETSFVNQYISVREIASDTQDVGWNSLITSGSKVKIIIIIIITLS